MNLMHSRPKCSPCHAGIRFDRSLFVAFIPARHGHHENRPLVLGHAPAFAMVGGKEREKVV